jgi:type VI secretion system secreted protein Hcp
LAATVAVTVSASASSVKPHALSVGSDIYSTIPGLFGEGSTAGGGGTIEINSFSMGVSRVPSGGAAGGPRFSSITISKIVDRTSPSFFKDVVSAVHYPTVTFTISKPSVQGQQTGDTLQILLSDVSIASWTISDASGTPMELITLNFSKIQLVYTPYGSSPASSAGWNLATHRAF